MTSKQAIYSDVKTAFEEALGHHQAGRLEDADGIYRYILSIEPQHADSLHLSGLIDQARGRLDAAVASIREAIRIQSNIPLYYNNLANILKHQGRLDEAIDHYMQALNLKPEYAEAAYNLGSTLHSQKKLQEACIYYERAITLQPNLLVAHVTLANALVDLGKIDEAVVHYRHALSIDPKSADVHYNLATALKDKGRFAEAIEHYQHMLAVKPDHASTHNNIGVLLRDQGRLATALEHFQGAITLKPDSAEAHVNRAMCLLLMGNLAEGWKEYEWRRQMKNVPSSKTDAPLWNGEDLHGKTVLLRGEQGLGDCLQFVRYAYLIKKRGARVMISCPSALSRLFRTMPAIDQVLSENALPLDYDFQVTLMSLPFLFETTLDTIPCSVPYLFPDKEEVAAWAKKLGDTKDLKVGLVWAGQSRPNHPAAYAVDLRRSMHISDFAPLASLAGVRFFSLQKGDPTKQLATLEAADLKIVDHMHDVHDFADTAAFIDNLDLVIGVDTSVVHLAGALGKPVWVISRFDGCWRWLLDREDSPWYPTLRIFRQPQPGNWQSVIEKIRNGLEKLVT